LEQSAYRRASPPRPIAKQLDSQLLGTVKFFNHHIHKTYYWLSVVELFMFFLAFHLGTTLYWHQEPNVPANLFLHSTPQGLLFSVVTWTAMSAMGMYQPHLREGSKGILLRTVGAFILMTLAMTLIFYFLPGLHLWRGVFVYTAAIAFLLSLISRWVFARMVNIDNLKSRVLVYGAGSAASCLLTAMRRSADRQGFYFVGFVHVEGDEDIIDKARVINLAEPLTQYVRNHRIDRVVVALSEYRDRIPLDELFVCKLNGVEVLNVLSFFEREAGKIMLDYLSPGIIVFSDGFIKGPLSTFAKRCVDIVGGFLMLMVAWPVMLMTCIAIWIEDGIDAPVVYRQPRVGQNGKTFKLIKMRSMNVDAESDGKPQWADKNDARITKVGRFIRKTRIDELPQIINVLAGDMSLIGPRPERPEFVQELAEKIPFYDVRHNVKPGISGWAQLRYPYGKGIDDAWEKLQFDLYYVKNNSLFLDFMIMLTTVEVVLFGRGAR